MADGAAGLESGAVALGGPEVLDNTDLADGRALVLMYPDYGGTGAFGLEAVRRYTGDTLVLVGEWADSTLGAYAEGVPESGQSFSAECQTLVRERFELQETVALPSWPLYRDVLRIWRRR